MTETTESDDQIIINTDSFFINQCLEDGYIEQTTGSNLLEIYELDYPDVNLSVKFLIFFPPEPGEEVPSWYPDGISHEQIYCVIDGEGASFRELFCVSGIDPLKRIAIECIDEFV